MTNPTEHARTTTPSGGDSVDSECPAGRWVVHLTSVSVGQRHVNGSASAHKLPARRAGPRLRSHAGGESVAHDIDQHVLTVAVANMNLRVKPPTPTVVDDDSCLVERDDLGGCGEDSITPLADLAVDLCGVGARRLCRGAGADPKQQRD